MSQNGLELVSAKSSHGRNLRAEMSDSRYTSGCGLCGDTQETHNCTRCRMVSSHSRENEGDHWGHHKPYSTHKASHSHPHPHPDSTLDQDSQNLPDALASLGLLQSSQNTVQPEQAQISHQISANLPSLQAPQAQFSAHFAHVAGEPQASQQYACPEPSAGVFDYQPMTDTQFEYNSNTQDIDWDQLFSSVMDNVDTDLVQDPISNTDINLKNLMVQDNIIAMAQDPAPLQEFPPPQLFQSYQTKTVGTMSPPGLSPRSSQPLSSQPLSSQPLSSQTISSTTASFTEDSPQGGATPKVSSSQVSSSTVSPKVSSPQIAAKGSSPKVSSSSVLSPKALSLKVPSPTAATASSVSREQAMATAPPSRKQIPTQDAQNHNRNADCSLKPSKIKQKHIREKETKIADYVVQCLKDYGLCVLDNFMGQSRGNEIVNEACTLYSQGRMKEGQIASDHEVKSVASKKVREDKIAWVEKGDKAYINIGYLIGRLDALMLQLNGRFENCNINGRTKVIILLCIKIIIE